MSAVAEVGEGPEEGASVVLPPPGGGAECKGRRNGSEK